MKKLIIIILVLIPTYTFALDKELAEKEWNDYEAKLFSKKLKDKYPVEPLEFPTQEKRNMFLQKEVVCVNKLGEEIKKEDCDRLIQLIADTPFLERFNSIWKSKEHTCSAIVTGESKKECLNWLLTKQEAYRAKIKMINDFGKIDSNTVEKFIQEYLLRLNENISFSDEKNKGLANSENTIKEIKTKSHSNECQSFRVLVSICQKSLVDATTKEATKLEDKITKESGVTNLYSRYQISQHRALHGTDKLPELIKNYKKLTSKDWSKELCDWDALTNKEEKKVCGCVDDENSDSSCPD